MKKDPLYQKLRIQLKEISSPPPQTLGPLTSYYKRGAAQVKRWPLKILLPLAFLSGAAAALLLGEKLTRLASVLQWGF